ncbi:MAG: hypothetical protein R3B81_04830 [bacterium]
MVFEEHSRAERIFNDALDLDEADRATFLDRKCGGDVELRAEVDSLLAHYAAAGGEYLEGGGCTRT